MREHATWGAVGSVTASLLREAADLIDRLTAPASEDVVDAVAWAIFEADKAIHGDLPDRHRKVASIEYEARARAAIAAISISVSADPAPPDPNGDTYYTKGKDASWFEGLSDKEFAWEITCAAQDLNDTGLGDAIDKWMPHNAMLSSAADRINRLIASHSADQIRRDEREKCAQVAEKYGPYWHMVPGAIRARSEGE